MDEGADVVARPPRPDDAADPEDALRLVFVATFVLNASTSVVFTLISDLQDATGLSTSTLGLITATGFVVGLVVQLLVGPLADRGGAKLLMLGGLALAVVGSTVFAFGTDLAVLLVARALVGAADGCFIPAARAIVAGRDPARAGERLGRLARVDLAGFVTGPIIGGVLVGPLGLRNTFLVFAVLALMAFIGLAPREVPPLPTTLESSRPSLTLLRDRQIGVAVLLALVLFLPVGVYDALWDRYLTDLGGSNLLIGMSFLLYGLPFVLLAAWGGRLADRIGHVRIAIIGVIALVPLVISYGVIHSAVVLAVLPMVEAVVQAATVPAAQAAMADACPPGRAAAGQGLAGATQLAGAAAAALVAAPIYAHLGSVAVFVTIGALMLVLALVAATMSRGAPTTLPQPAQV